MSKSCPQCKRLLEYLTQYGSITRAEAMSKLGIANLTAVIAEMRKHSIPIVTERVKTKNRYGELVYYAKYYVLENENDS